MTGKSPRKRVDALHWQGRLRAARAYLEAARQAHLLAEGQERRYRRILSFKDEVQYGTRKSTRDEAARLLADLEAFAGWAQELL